MRGHAHHGSGSMRPTVAWAKVPGQPIAQLSIRDFSATAHDEFQRALQEMTGQGIHGLILDLRGCPGGWRAQAIALASEFLSDGNVLLERDGAGRQTAIPVRPNGHARDLPLCVLVDADTASCAEILAAALQDHDRGTVIGTQTFGAGTLLQPFPLSDGSALLLAVAEWRTPNGRRVWHKGLTPDIEVRLPAGMHRLTPDAVRILDAEALAASEDTQFLTALKELERDRRAGR
jgi:carboxyl-terminal processing protease